MSTWANIRRLLSDLSLSNPHKTATSSRLSEKPLPPQSPSRQTLQARKQQLAKLQSERSRHLGQNIRPRTPHSALIEESYFSLYGLHRSAADGAWHCMSCNTRNPIICIPSSRHPFGFLACRYCKHAWTSQHPSTNVLIPNIRGADGVVCSSCGLSHARARSGKGSEGVHECICGARRDETWTYFKFGSNEDYRSGNPDATFVKEFERQKGISVVDEKPKPEEYEITIALQVLVPEYSVPSPPLPQSPNSSKYRGSSDGSSNGGANQTGTTIYADLVSTFTQMQMPIACSCTSPRHDSVHQPSPTPTLSPSAQREAFAERAYKSPTAKRWPVTPPENSSASQAPRDARTSQQVVYKSGAEMWRDYHEDSFVRREWEKGRRMGLDCGMCTLRKGLGP